MKANSSSDGVLITKYPSARRLYCATTAARQAARKAGYVTLEELAEIIRDGRDVSVRLHTPAGLGQDVTAVALLEIIRNQIENGEGPTTKQLLALIRRRPT